MKYLSAALACTLTLAAHARYDVRDAAHQATNNLASRAAHVPSVTPGMLADAQRAFAALHKNVDEVITLLDTTQLSAQTHVLAHRFLSLCADIAPAKIITWMRNDMVEKVTTLVRLSKDITAALRTEQTKQAQQLLAEMEGGTTRMLQWFNPHLFDASSGHSRNLVLTPSRSPAGIAAAAIISLLVVGGVTFAVVQQRRNAGRQADRVTHAALQAFESEIKSANLAYHNTVSSSRLKLTREQAGQLHATNQFLTTLFTTDASGKIIITPLSKATQETLSAFASGQTTSPAILNAAIEEIGGSTDKAHALVEQLGHSDMREAAHQAELRKNSLLRRLARQLCHTNTADPHTIDAHTTTHESLQRLILAFSSAVSPDQRNFSEPAIALLAAFDENPTTPSLDELMELLGYFVTSYNNLPEVARAITDDVMPPKSDNLQIAPAGLSVSRAPRKHISLIHPPERMKDLLDRVDRYGAEMQKKKDDKAQQQLHAVHAMQGWIRTLRKKWARHPAPVEENPVAVAGATPPLPALLENTPIEAATSEAMIRKLATVALGKTQSNKSKLRVRVPLHMRISGSGSPYKDSPCSSENSTPRALTPRAA